MDSTGFKITKGMLKKYTGKGGDVVIPGSVKEIGEWAFEDNTALTSVVIPDSVKKIGFCAFYKCANLKCAVIPESITVIEDGAFEGCKNLTDVNIPDSVEEIGDGVFNDTAIFNNESDWEDGVLYIGNNCIYANRSFSGECIIKAGTRSIAKKAFNGCSNLTGIVIPDSVTKLSEDMFCGCTNLTSVVIPDSVTMIGYGAFRDCASLIGVIIPHSVTEIRGGAFSGCASLANFTVPDSVTEISRLLFYKCSSLTNITIPDTVTEICESAFEGCTSLTNIDIPDSVTKIGFRAFYECTSLESVVIPRSVTYINGDLFYRCASLVSVTIPDSVTEIYGSAFYGCTSLTSITIPDSVKYMQGGLIFYGCPDFTILASAGSCAEKYAKYFFINFETIDPSADLRTVYENRIMNKYRDRYEKVFKVMYPAKNSTGFTERNLSVNFSKAVEELFPTACSWFEYRFGEKNNLHYDAVIVVPETKTIYLVESKRFSSIKAKITGKKGIGNDMLRINSASTECKSEFIGRITGFDGYTVLGVILADVWTGTRGEKRQIKESFDKKEFISAYIPDMVESFRDGRYYVEGFDSQSDNDGWKNKYYLVSMIWKVI